VIAGLGDDTGRGFEMFGGFGALALLQIKTGIFKIRFWIFSYADRVCLETPGWQAPAKQQYRMTAARV
jgi:hypothetical protein